MSDSNAPENVDLDETFNHIDPSLLQAILVKNMTHAIDLTCRKASMEAMPMALAGVAGIKPTMEEQQSLILKLMHAFTIVKDMNDLIKKAVPIHDEELSAERVEEIKESIVRHPLIIEAAFRITESVEEKLARKDG